MGEGYRPETNSSGLVIPPTTELGFFALQVPRRIPRSINRHHLYWPSTYYAESTLSKNFRDCLFNSFWMLITEHDDIHGNFEGVEKPDKDTMEGYLEEAKIISELNMCVSGVRKTNADIDEGRVLKHRLNRCRGRQEEKVQTIYRNIELSVSFSLIQEEVTRMAVENALLLPHIDESLVVGHAA